MSIEKGRLFNLNYFLEGPYKKSTRVGKVKIFGQFYWARRFYAQLIKKYKLSGKLLEIGCGFGDQLIFLEDNFECIGIDISEDAISEAKKNSKAKFRVMKIEDIDRLGKNQFDVIIANHIFEHIENPAIAIYNCNKVLKPEGILLMATPNPTSIMKKFKKEKWIGFQDKTHISLLEPSRWQSILIKNEFKVLKKFGDGFWAVPYIGFIPNILQLLLFDLLGIIQTVFILSFIPVVFGESIIIVAQKSESQRLI